MNNKKSKAVIPSPKILKALNLLAPVQEYHNGEAIGLILLKKLILIFLLVFAVSSATLANQPSIVSVNELGVQANWHSYKPTVSFDGRFIAFESDATNLVSGDTNARRDIFVKDTITGAVTRASVSSTSLQSTGSNYLSRISGNGRYMVFQSSSSNLVPGDTNSKRDIFVRDLQALTTARVSVGSSGNQANNNSIRSDISSDGRYVAFESDATNLVIGDVNLKRDIFVHDLITGTTEIVSIGTDEIQGNSGTLAFSISGDGRYVAFESAATNLVPNDTNGVRDIFVRNRFLGTTIRATTDANGFQSNGGSENPSLDSGRYVSFESYASNLVAQDKNDTRDIFVKDIETGSIVIASVSSQGVQASAKSEYSSLSDDGRYVVFRSQATNLAEGVTLGLGYIYFRDIILGLTSFVVENPIGPLTDASTQFIPAISGDGVYTVFESTSILTPGDANGVSDIFIVRN